MAKSEKQAAVSQVDLLTPAGSATCSGCLLSSGSGAQAN